MTTDDLSTLVAKASNVLEQGADGVKHGAVHVVSVLDQVEQFRAQADQIAELALLPLGLVLLILHEHHRAAADHAPFRVGHIFLRAGVIVALLLGYGKLCGIITHIAGAGGGWFPTDYLGDLFANQALGNAWDRLGGGLSDLPKYLAILIVWFLVMCSALFAYVAGALLSQIQAAGLALLVGLGKTCIVLSIVPGIELGKSWARSLAQIAAWSTVAGVITHLLAAKNLAIADAIVRGEFVVLFKASAQFIILGAMTLAVPLITAKLFSGGAAGLSEVLPAIGAFKLASSYLSGDRSRGARGADNSGAGSAEGGGRNGRGGAPPLPRRAPRPAYAAVAQAAGRVAGAVRRRLTKGSSGESVSFSDGPTLEVEESSILSERPAGATSSPPERSSDHFSDEPTTPTPLRAARLSPPEPGPALEVDVHEAPTQPNPVATAAALKASVADPTATS